MAPISGSFVGVGQKFRLCDNSDSSLSLSV